MANQSSTDHPEDFRDRLTTITESGKRAWVYASKPFGKWTSRRTVLQVIYLLLFFSIPFIKWNGKPFFMIHFFKGEFILFGKIFWPDDFIIFAVGMLALIICVVIFTVLYGRVFCGWVCPQTVFMEGIFRKIEWWIEGSPNQQKKRNEAPWDTAQYIRKITKHTLFLAIAFLIGNTFLAYIVGIESLQKIIHEPIAQHKWLFTGIIVFTLIFYIIYAYVREIVCTTICPYGRLQGVMIDPNTMNISYDYVRGEPRGKISKNQIEKKGDCIDCKKCVTVCPTGIDIRDGIQMECVGCTACIDACDEVMIKVGYEPGLIRYASENQIAQGVPFRFTRRIKAYSGVLCILVGIMAYLIFSSNSIDTHISRVRGQLYQEVKPGFISNLYTAKTINKTNDSIPLFFKLENIEGEVKMVTSKVQYLKKEAINEFTFFVEIPKIYIQKHKTDIQIGVYTEKEKIQTISTTFLGPFSQ